MTAEELRAVCAALNLKHRQAADLIGANERNFRRMVGGKVPVSFAVQAAMEKLLEQSREQL